MESAFFPHLQRLARVNYYAAPATARVTPVAIPDNIECIEVLTAGKLFFEWEGEEREFTRGTVFWHLAGEQTIWNTVPEAPYCCVVLAYVVNQRKRSAPRVSQWSHAGEAAEFAERALKFFHSGIDDLPAFTAYTYSNLLWNALRQAKPAPWPAALQGAVEYLNEHWNEPVEGEDLARCSHASKPYLFALFREHLKTSPHQYLLQLRINRAKFFLANSDSAIKEIAQTCGFASLEVFYRQFRKAVRMTPLAYRQGSQPYRFQTP